MTTHEHYRNGRERLRAWASRRTPRILTQFPFEVLVAVIAICMGLPFLIGTAAPASLLAIVGTVFFHFWAAALVIGGGTIAIAMRIGERPNPLVLAAGLQLAGGCFAVYCLAIVAVLGLPGLTALVAYLALSLLSFVRATHFRRVVDIQEGAGRLGDST